MNFVEKNCYWEKILLSATVILDKNEKSETSNRRCLLKTSLVKYTKKHLIWNLKKPDVPIVS